MIGLWLWLEKYMYFPHAIFLGVFVTEREGLRALNMSRTAHASLAGKGLSRISRLHL
jgi:hypothetical protein